MTRGDSVVSKEDIAAFERDGVVLLRGVIDATAQDSLHAAIARELERPQGFFGRRLLWRSDPDLAQFCRDSPTPRIIAELFGSSTVNLFMDQLFAKAPGTATRTGWHNDLPGIVTLTPWLRHGRCFIVSECARYLTVVTAFRRSSSSMPSGCIAVSR